MPLQHPLLSHLRPASAIPASMPPPSAIHRHMPTPPQIHTCTHVGIMQPAQCLAGPIADRRMQRPHVTPASHALRPCSQAHTCSTRTRLTAHNAAHTPARIRTHQSRNDTVSPVSHGAVSLRVACCVSPRRPGSRPGGSSRDTSAAGSRAEAMALVLKASDRLGEGRRHC